RVLVDGRPLEELDLEQLRRSASYLPQRPYLGEGYNTVRSAIALAVDASDDAMLTALERVGLALPLATRLGELSAGQRQRLALARVLLQDTPIVLVDEPD